MLLATACSIAFLQTRSGSHCISAGLVILVLRASTRPSQHARPLASFCDCIVQGPRQMRHHMSSMLLEAGVRDHEGVYISRLQYSYHLFVSKPRCLLIMVHENVQASTQKLSLLSRHFTTWLAQEGSAVAALFSHLGNGGGMSLETQRCHAAS